MRYKLFLDDVRLIDFWMVEHGCYTREERDEYKRDWKLARNVEEAKQLIINFGCPEEMSLDHDLGEIETGMDFIKWLVEYDMEKDIIFKGMKFICHSANPEGSKNIRSYYNNYIKMKF